MAIALSAGLTKNEDCFDKPTGIISTIFINIGFLKLLAVLIYTATYFRNIRSFLNNYDSTPFTVTLI